MSFTNLTSVQMHIIYYRIKIKYTTRLKHWTFCNFNSYWVPLFFIYLFHPWLENRNKELISLYYYLFSNHPLFYFILIQLAITFLKRVGRNRIRYVQPLFQGNKKGGFHCSNTLNPLSCLLILSIAKTMSVSSWRRDLVFWFPLLWFVDMIWILVCRYSNTMEVRWLRWSGRTASRSQAIGVLVWIYRQ